MSELTYNAVGSDKTLLDITSLILKEIVVEEQNVTTNTNGQAALNLPAVAPDIFVLGVWTKTNTTTKIEPYIGATSGQWWISCRRVSDDSKVASTSLSVNIAYMYATV